MSRNQVNSSDLDESDRLPLSGRVCRISEHAIALAIKRRWRFARSSGC